MRRQRPLWNSQRTEGCRSKLTKDSDHTNILVMNDDNSQQPTSAVEFFDRNPVFHTEEFHVACCRSAKRGSRSNLLNYFVRRGRILPIRRGVYAVVPYSRRVEDFKPNRYLVASALKPDTVLSHHTALEVLGQAHSVSRTLYGFTARSPSDFAWNDYRFKILRYPRALNSLKDKNYGVTTREIEGQTVVVTGPERTLADCLASPSYAGGVEEAVVSLRGFPSLF